MHQPVSLWKLFPTLCQVPFVTISSYSHLTHIFKSVCYLFECCWGFCLWSLFFTLIIYFFETMYWLAWSLPQRTRWPHTCQDPAASASVSAPPPMLWLCVCAIIYVCTTMYVCATVHTCATMYMRVTMCVYGTVPRNLCFCKCSNIMFYFPPH